MFKMILRRLELMKINKDKIDSLKSQNEGMQKEVTRKFEQ